jgi:hypothetical protein
MNCSSKRDGQIWEFVQYKDDSIDNLVEIMDFVKFSTKYTLYVRKATSRKNAIYILRKFLRDDIHYCTILKGHCIVKNNKKTLSVYSEEDFFEKFEII